MERLYRKMVLKEEQPEGGFVPISSILPANAKAAKKEEEEVGSFGD
jgi:hypothetical protein